jgi:inner membrane protein
MQGFNHIAGGLAFTGIFASFADVNLFSKPEYIVACVFFSLLADIDHTKSPIGKLFWPVARWLDKKYGHRTVTHSLGFYLAVVGAVGLAEQLLTGGRTVTGVTALAYGSHLLFDMCTRQGIPLFMPFTRARCVLPGNPNMRLSNRSPLAEVVVFFGFCLLLLTTMPLMANGFWATINNEFATFGHVLRESQRKPDILFLQTTEGEAGQVVAATTDGAVVYNGRQFVQLSKGKHHPSKFRHTGKPVQPQRLEFVGISSDSLRALFKQPLMAMLATASAPIRFRNEGQQFEQTVLKVDYPQAFEFSEVLPDTSATLAQIARLRATVAAAAAAVWKHGQEQRQKAAQVQRLQLTYEKLSAYEQGKATEETARLQAELRAAKAPDTATETAANVAEITRLKKALKGQKHTFTGVCTIWKP